MNDAEYRKLVRKARKAAGECVACGHKDERTVRGLTLCEKCAMSHKVAAKRLREKEKEKGNDRKRVGESPAESEEGR